MKSEAKILQEGSHSLKMIDIDKEEITIFPLFYSYAHDAPKDLLHLVAGGEKNIIAPHSVYFDPMPFFSFTYCIDGALLINEGSESCTLNPGDFLIRDLFSPYKVTSVITPCTLRFFFLNGASLDIFRSLHADYSPFSPDPERRSVFALEELVRFPEKISTHDLLGMNLLLTRILTSYFMNTLSSGEPDQTEGVNLPFYLIAMRNEIQNQSQHSISLQSFEARFNISRYRLCREYHDAFGISPIQDLIRHRIENAKRLLLTSGMRIQEISSSTGFDDVNNFIRLFKKSTGMTPGRFRQSADPNRLL